MLRAVGLLLDGEKLGSEIEGLRWRLLALDQGLLVLFDSHVTLDHVLFKARLRAEDVISLLLEAVFEDVRAEGQGDIRGQRIF